MEFISDSHKAVYKQCARLMMGLFGDSVRALPGRTAFCVDIGSAQVELAVVPYHDDAIVMTSATVISGAAVDADLTMWLLQQNATIDLGAFALAPNGDIVFKHAIMGGGLDENELRMSVWSVMRIADDYDDAIKGRWGGQRAIDQAGEVFVSTGSNRVGGNFSDATDVMHIDDINAAKDR